MLGELLVEPQGHGGSYERGSRVIAFSCYAIGRLNAYSPYYCVVVCTLLRMFAGVSATEPSKTPLGCTSVFFGPTGVSIIDLGAS